MPRSWWTCRGAGTEYPGPNRDRLGALQKLLVSAARMDGAGPQGTRARNPSARPVGDDELGLESGPAVRGDLLADLLRGRRSARADVGRVEILGR